MINGHNIFLIVAVDEKNGIGKEGDLAWRLKKEMQHFKRVTLETQNSTKHNMLIMGRTTWESIPEKFRPLPDRKNVVLTRDAHYTAPGATVATTYEDALAAADAYIETIFIIGGAQVYAQALEHAITDGVYITRIHHNFSCDTFFPHTPNYTNENRLGSAEENGIEFDYYLLTK